MNIFSLIRPNIRSLKPYSSARSEFMGEASVFLDANENAFGSPIEIEGFRDLNRYPDPRQNLLRKKIAYMRGVKKENLFLGVGSDEAIDLLIRIFCEPGKSTILTTPPTYGLYKVAAHVNDVTPIEVPLTKKFQLKTDDILEVTDKTTKIIFLCSPNNPTGNCMDKREMIKLCENFSGMVLVDEAYADFANPKKSMMSEVGKIPNLVVLRTFSKAWGMAGIRLGLAFADPKLIEIMLKIKSPYNVNILTIQSALKALEKKSRVDEWVKKIRSERERLSLQLKKISPKVFPSESNFILFQIPNALKVYDKLVQQGVIVRYRGNDPLCENCLRVTIGTPDQNDLFLQTLQSIL